MAKVHDLRSGAMWEGDEAARYLMRRGVLYEAWDMTGLGPDFGSRPNPVPDDEASIPDRFRPGLKRLARERGYVSHDMIVLNRPAQPNLPEVLIKFGPNPSATGCGDRR